MRMLLQTKLFCPTLPAALVARPRLDRQFALAHLPRLTLVAAPAGSGKTTLVAAWLQQLGTAAWLSLDEQDNQIDQFLLYLIAAFQTVDPMIGQIAQVMLQSGQPAEPNSILAGLLNDIAASKRDVTIVLDDYHAISEPVIHHILTVLLDRAPPQFHLILITRHDPPLPLARWRVRNQLTEVRAADLRFTHDETIQFLTRAMNSEVSAAAIEILEQRTEGWIAGLQLAALSLRRQPDAQAFIERFSGSDRFVADYLIEEVLGQQPPDMRLFLLCTSVLQRFSAKLCHALLADLAPVRDADMAGDTADCQARIEILDNTNLFIVPLDDQREWYRFHQLFADLLRSRLRREYPELWVELHRRASRWHEQQDLLDAAMHYGLVINDGERTMTLIEQHGLRLAGDGLIATILGWMRHPSDAQLRQHPLVCVVGAWAYMLTQQVERAEQLIDVAEQELDSYTPVTFAHDGSVFLRQELVAHLVALRAFAASSRSQAEQAIALAQQALVGLPAGVSIIHPPLYQLLGVAYTSTGQLEHAQQALRQAADVALVGHNRYIAVSARSILGNLLADIGAITEAQQAYHKAIAVGSPPETAYVLPPVALPLLNLAWMHYRWNDLPATDAYLVQAERLAQPGGFTEISLWAALLRARRDTTALEFARAATWIDQAAVLVGQYPHLRANGYDLAIARGRLALHAGQLAEAEQQLAQCGVPWTAFRGQDVRLPAGYQFFVQHQDFFPTLGQLLIAQRQFSAARELVAWLASAATATQYIVVRVQTTILDALLYQTQQQPVRAQVALGNALDLAAPGNLQRVLIEFGSPVVALLQKALPDTTHAPFIQKVLATPEFAYGFRPAAPTSALPEPLTERETQIMRLLAAGLNSTEIAAQLIIAPSTVRSYIKNLYAKLNVNRRYDAVERARALNLL